MAGTASRFFGELDLVSVIAFDSGCQPAFSTGALTKVLAFAPQAEQVQQDGQCEDDRTVSVGQVKRVLARSAEQRCHGHDP